MNTSEELNLLSTSQKLDKPTILQLVFIAILSIVGAAYLTLSLHDKINVLLRVKNLVPTYEVPIVRDTFMGANFVSTPMSNMGSKSVSTELKKLTIMPKGNNNPLSHGREIWLFGVSSSNGIALPSELSEGWEVRPDWRGYQQNVFLYSGQKAEQPKPLVFSIASEEPRIKLLKHPWSGQVDITEQNVTTQLDLFSPLETTTEADLYLVGTHTFNVSIPLFWMLLSNFDVVNNDFFYIESATVDGNSQINFDNHRFLLNSTAKILILLSFIGWILVVLALITTSFSIANVKILSTITIEYSSWLILSSWLVFCIIIIASSPYILDDYSNSGLNIWEGFNLASPGINRFPLFYLFVKTFLNPKIPTEVIHTITALGMVVTSFSWAMVLLRLSIAEKVNLQLGFFIGLLLLLNPLYSQIYIWFSASYPLWIMFWFGLAALSLQSYFKSKRKLFYLLWIGCGSLGTFFGEHGVLMALTVPLLLVVFNWPKEKPTILIPKIAALHSFSALIPYLLLRIYLGIQYHSWIGVIDYKTNFSLNLITNIARDRISIIAYDPYIKTLIFANLILMIFGLSKAFISIGKAKISGLIPMVFRSEKILFLLQLMVPFGIFIVSILPYLLIGGWWNDHYYFIPTLWLTLSLVLPIIRYAPWIIQLIPPPAYKYRYVMIGACLVLAFIGISQIKRFNVTTLDRIPILSKYVNGYIETLKDATNNVSETQKKVFFVNFKEANLCPVGLFGGACPNTVAASWVIPALKRLGIFRYNSLIYIVNMGSITSTAITLYSHDWFITTNEFHELAQLAAKKGGVSVQLITINSSGKSTTFSVPLFLLKRDNGEEILFKQ